MQQRQLRLGDILDDYCPRERRLTNHAIVAMIGDDVKQTRCTTCDCDHEYKHAKVPRQRKKSDGPAALYAQVAAGAPKRVAHEEPDGHEETEIRDPEVHEGGEGHEDHEDQAQDESHGAPSIAAAAADPDTDTDGDELLEDEDDNIGNRSDDGPAHRRLIRASLPRPEGQQPPARPIPEFTIRQPGSRPNRFRPRHQRGGGGQGFGMGGGNRGGGNFGGPMRGNGNMRMAGGGGKRHHGGGGRKRSK